MRTVAVWFLGLLFVLLLGGLLYATMSPDTDPSGASPGLADGRATRSLPPPTPSPAPGRAPAPETAPSALQGRSWQLRCPARDLPDGPLRFLKLEPFAPSATRLVVTGGVLEGRVSLPEGEGDLGRGSELVGRLRWSEDADDVSCEVIPVPRAGISGVVLDARGNPAGDAKVSGCGEQTTAGPDGRFVLEVPGGKLCRLRAVLSGRLQRVSEVVEASAPAEVELEVREPRSTDQMAEDLQGTVRRLSAMLEVQKQLSTALPDAPSPEDLGSMPTAEEIERIEAVLQSGDPDAILEAWLSYR